MDYSVPLTSRGESIDIVNDNISLIQHSEFFKFGTDSLMLAGFICGRK